MSGIYGQSDYNWPQGQDQWLRRWSLILTAQNNPTGASAGIVPQVPNTNTGVVLSSDDTSFGLSPPSEGLRMRFRTVSADGPTPAYAIITVYNLADTTAASVVQEFNHVTLQAGYQQGRFGVIFDGIIKQYKRGHDDNMTESYLEIYAAEADLFFNQSFMATTIQAGSTAQMRRTMILTAATNSGVQQGQQTSLQGGTLPRARVFYGNTVDEANDIAHSTGTSWSISNNQLIWMPTNGSLQGEAIQLNAQTGLIGYPESTDEGISVTCLLNPDIQVRGLVQINNGAINTVNAPGGSLITQFPSPGSPIQAYAGTDADGMYIVLVKSYEGDTRGLPWFCHLICISQDAFNSTGLSLS
jgi:hypothetical protein